MAEQEQTIGLLALRGRAPEDGTWFFDETQAKVNGYTVAYELPNRKAAEDAGIPPSILDLYEKQQGTEYEPNDLFFWFCENGHLFRSVEADDDDYDEEVSYDDED